MDWITGDALDQKIDTPEYNEILNLATRILSIPCNHQPEEIRISFRNMIGQGLARCFQGNCNYAKTMLNDAEKFILARNNEVSRYWYLLATGFTAIVTSLIGLIIWLNRNGMIYYMGIPAFWLILAACFGSLGALLSVIFRLGKSTMTPEAGKSLHYLEGFYRIIAGSISAVFISLSILSGFILPSVVKPETIHLWMLLGGFAAGASERLAPSLIGSVENNINKSLNTKRKK